MIEFMNFLTIHQKWIILSHVISAIIFMGGVVTLSFTIHHLVRMEPVKDYNLRIVMSIIKRFLIILGTPSLLWLMISAVIMQIGFLYKNSNPIFLTIVHTNIFIWIFMFLLFLYIVKKRFDAKKHYKEGNLFACKNDLILIIDYLFTLEFFLGGIATYFGLMLKGV